MKFLLCLLLLSSYASAGTNLLLIGGGKRPVEAMKTFADIAGKEKADILIFPWASESIEAAESIKAEFSAHTKGLLRIVPHRLAPKDLEKLILNIDKCSGIFFTGGDQNKLMSFIKEYQLIPLFKKKFQEGVIFGGTSAGTAIMSNPMLTGEGDLSVIKGSQIELAEGLGLLPPNVIVDQHFVVRQRFNRLAGLVLDKSGVIGIGVDENTAFLVQGNNARVIGPTQVLIFEKMGADKMSITLLKQSQRFKIR
jgi:cyanophycinase